MQAVAGVTDSEEADPASGSDNVATRTLQPSLRQCLDSPQLWPSVPRRIFLFGWRSKRENNLVHFMMFKKKQANRALFFRAK